MSKKEPDPDQLPEIIIQEPTKQSGFVQIRVPIPWKDFMGLDKVSGIAVATLNIRDAILKEFDNREAAQRAAKTEAREKEKVKADEKKVEERGTAIQKIIDEEPDAVMAKRKEFGVDVIDDLAAAAIIHNERQAPLEKPAGLPKSATKKKAPSKPVDTGDYDPPPLPDGDFGETVRFYKSDYGWSAYLDNEKEDAIPVLFDWLVSIPKEVRHRRSDKYPTISHSGKFIMLNDYEKSFMTTVAEAKGMKIIVKED